MQIVFIILGIILLLLILLTLSNVRISIKYENFGDEGNLIVKAYILKFIRVSKIHKVMKSEKKKFKEQVKFVIDYLFKSKADPIEYAEKEVKKSKDTPEILRMIDISKIFIDYFSLDLCLDFDNAAITAISTGAANAIIGMVLSKYDNNIKGPMRYKVYPGYTGDGIKIKFLLKIHIRILDIIILLLKKKNKKEE